jgi:hypothetical protein
MKILSLTNCCCKSVKTPKQPAREIYGISGITIVDGNKLAKQLEAK